MSARARRPLCLALAALVAAGPALAGDAEPERCAGEPLRRALVARRGPVRALARDLADALRHVDPRILRGQVQLLCAAVQLPAAPDAVPGGFFERARRRAASLRACRPATLNGLARLQGPALARLVAEAVGAMDLTPRERSRLDGRMRSRAARGAATEDSDPLEVEGLVVLARHDLVLRTVARLHLALWSVSASPGGAAATAAFERIRRGLDVLDEGVCPAEPQDDAAPGRGGRASPPQRHDERGAIKLAGAADLLRSDGPASHPGGPRG